jgi:alkyl sulfatase BDS1-like metallo-beta-lactamase superfamily hydrolase
MPLWAGIAVLVLSCHEEPIRVVELHEELPKGPPAPHALTDQAKAFERRVIEVTEGVHVAVGFGLSNSILLEGDDGVIVIDTMGTIEAGRAVREAFQQITDKPIRAIIYTHHHAEQVFGSQAFVSEAQRSATEVIAHTSTAEAIARSFGALRPALSRRANRMFGTTLQEGEQGFLHNGIGPAREVDRGGHLGLLHPQRTFSESLSLEIAGLRIELVHAPGETADHIFVWLPEKRVLLPGDNIYKAFPNLSPLRGGNPIDALAWARSLDAMRALRAEHLVPSHMGPMSGADEIEATLLAYRNAIRYVHDQTVRGINQGLTPDQLVQEVVLPPHLANHPYLQEVYGTVAWAVRAIFSGYLGWFDGEATTLSPPNPVDRARATIALAGGINAVIEAADDALAEGQAAWAAELIQHVLVIAPGHEDARAVKASALRQLGRTSLSAIARNYSLSQARAWDRDVTAPPEATAPPPLDERAVLPVDLFMRALPVRLNAARARDVDHLTVVELIDPGAPAVLASTWTIQVRHGVADVERGDAPDATLRVRTSPRIWMELINGERDAASPREAEQLTTPSDPTALDDFLRLFQEPIPGSSPYR